MKGEMEKSGRFLVIAIFFLFFIFISTAQGAWDNDDLMYANVLGTTEIRLPVHNINTVEDFENIQAAIDDPDTKDGHTISVDAGIYRERVVINKQLKIIGANKDTTIIDGYGSGKCIQVTADNVEISRFTIKNGDYGIYLESSNCRVIDNYITSIDFDGISLRSNSVNNTIAHNRLSKVNGKGIRLSSSSNNRIHDNDLSDNGKGISLSSSHNNIIYHNGLTYNSNCGICLSSSNNNTIQDNDLSGSEEGISLRGCNKNYIYHNNFIDNRIQASDSSDTNRWDNGPIDGGNYWSDHECTGNPSDGNQPYNISGGIMGATDFYPFMDRDGWFTPPSSPTLADPGTNDTDGNYIVSWSTVNGATNYTLEEDTNSSFSSPTIVYSRSGTSKEIIGKSEGTCYYRVKACNECGCSDWSNKENITIKIDTIPPTVTITYPTSGQTLTTSNITVNGTASDNVAVSKVEVKVGSGDWQTASGTTSWSTPVTLALGPNTINAIVTDASGNINQTSVTVICDMLANLTVTILYPNGGEYIPVGTQVPVSVHATDDTAVTNVTFFYSSNDGSTWNLIGAGIRVSGTDKDGIWNGTWNTNGLSVGSKYMIKAVASDGTLTREDLSESTFSLCTLPSPPTLTDPGTNDTDGNYIVSWSSVTSATNYTLEEDTNGSFSNPTMVYSGSGTSKEITGKSNGTYYYRVKACNECGCSKWSNRENIKIRELLCYAIIIAGRNNDLMQSCYDCTANSVYKKLLPSGFTNDSIFYLNPSMKQDVDGDDIPVDRISSLTNISYAINTWAWGNVSANDSLLIYMVGHCNNKSDKFIVNGANDALTASYLNNSLNQLTNARGCDNITVVCEACNSGSFIYNHSCKGRIIVTSTGVNADSMNNETMGGVFSYYFFDNISTGKTIKDAFEAASKSKMIIQNSKNLINASRPPQTPLLDDNGDGNGSAIPLNNDTDGSLAACRYICTQRNGSGTQGNGHSYNSLIPAIRFEEV